MIFIIWNRGLEIIMRWIETKILFNEYPAPWNYIMVTIALLYSLLVSMQ